MMNIAQLSAFITDAKLLIENNSVEDKLRHHLSSKLLSIFPDKPWWVQAHMLGTEQFVRYATENGIKNGFVDAVVGKTVIEYEKNLNIKDIFNEGYKQVKEYSAALCNVGIPDNEVLGVLSDTIHWYGYKVHLINKKDIYGPDDVELEEINFINLELQTTEEFNRFENFINKFMARNNSRLLNASTLSIDFGVESNFYKTYIQLFSKVVSKAFNEKKEYANLIKQLWQNFIAYLGVSDYGKFSEETYVSEFYLVTIAKIICANVLSGKALFSSQEEIKEIINGIFFTKQNIHNFIDYDYFGWLNYSPYVELIVPCAQEIQKELSAYDFSRITDEDLFGQLLAQLANKEHRLMLGQEFTPHWVARNIVSFNLDKLSEEPRIIDMCCGSGIFLIESLKNIRKKYNITIDSFDETKDSLIFSSVTGFDIDPLAVMLAKVNWILSMRDLFQLHNGSIIVPIYHADSLFVSTQITHKKTKDDDNYYLKLNEEKIKIPAFLFTAEYRNIFDVYISKIYHIAMTRASVPIKKVTKIDTNIFIKSVIKECKTEIDEDKKSELADSAGQMITQLELLQRNGKNGIWHFIICNSYRPGLTENQFNCVISNPPWMAMSKLADNPYKNALNEIADKYGLKPTGPSHPHMELATIFLVSSIKRYLKNNSPWSFIMPASIMSGLNHEPFRNELFRDSEKHLNTSISSIWELPINTFKNKAIVLSGVKGEGTLPKIDGRIYDLKMQYNDCSYSLNRQGERTAWTKNEHTIEIQKTVTEPIHTFTQGCDLFPRTVLYHTFTKNQNSTWKMSPIERTGSLWYLINDSKKEICNQLEATNIEDDYIYDSYISKHLSPFIMSEPAKILMPGKKEHGVWNPITQDVLALLNPSTSYVFNTIKEEIKDNLESYLLETINIYEKLVKQVFNQNCYLILSSASGSNPCAAYINLNDYNIDKLIIDQTLYWLMVNNEEEAIYITGLLNSPALAKAISGFQPEGAFGKRHIHTLPYKLIQKYNKDNPNHKNIVLQTKNLINEWKSICEEEEYKHLIHPNSGNLNVRRKKQQAKIKSLQSYNNYDEACSSLFN